jgi:hypothetical protein
MSHATLIRLDLALVPETPRPILGAIAHSLHMAWPDPVDDCLIEPLGWALNSGGRALEAIWPEDWAAHQARNDAGLRPQSSSGAWRLVTLAAPPTARLSLAEVFAAIGSWVIAEPGAVLGEVSPETDIDEVTDARRKRIVMTAEGTQIDSGAIPERFESLWFSCSDEPKGGV